LGIFDFDLPNAPTRFPIEQDAIEDNLSSFTASNGGNKHKNFKF